MKYVVLLCDGMADLPCDALNGKTPMEAAHKPTMDALAAQSEVGMAKTIPDELPPGSDVANLSVLGYDPADCYTGRSPLEAANIGIDLKENDLALRCNFVTLTDDEPFKQKKMVDYCAGDIHTEEASVLIQTLQSDFGGGDFDFYTGTAYRHCAVWHSKPESVGPLTPPHDISGKEIGKYLPVCETLNTMMTKSFEILQHHPVNEERRKAGLHPANSIWLWGQGTRPKLENFTARFGLKGAMISAVDLLKGIARLNGMTVCEVEGATGYIDTNFKGKMLAAADALTNGHDLAYIHLEAPDECGHRGEAENKVKAIEHIDRLILTPLLPKLEALGPYAILICPDHPTPLTLRTHTRDPIPFLIYHSDRKTNGVPLFTESAAASTGIFLPQGKLLMRRLTGH